MTEPKAYALGDVLSVTTGCLLSFRGMEGVYDILNHMTGDNLFTHQLPRAQNECRGPLLEQHPQLVAIRVPEFEDEAHVWRWLAEQIEIYGEALPVIPLGEGEHEQRNPVEELCDMVGPEKVFVVNPDDMGAEA